MISFQPFLKIIIKIIIISHVIKIIIISLVILYYFSLNNYSTVADSADSLFPVADSADSLSFVFGIFSSVPLVLEILSSISSVSMAASVFSFPLINNKLFLWHTYSIYVNFMQVRYRKPTRIKCM